MSNHIEKIEQAAKDSELRNLKQDSYASGTVSPNFGKVNTMTVREVIKMLEDPNVHQESKDRLLDSHLAEHVITFSSREINLSDFESAFSAPMKHQ